jgi:hypothetical protein
MRKILLILSISVAAVLALGRAGEALAATKSGITISPTFQEISILPNQTGNTNTFAVSNNNDSPVTFDLAAIDMGALDDSGGVVFSGLSTDYQQKYGLAKWLQIDQPTLMIAPHSTQNVKFTIVNDATLSPGGHYGAIVVKPQGENSGQSQINLQPQAASLLFVKKLGGEVAKLQLETPKTKTYWWHLPSQIDLVFRNTGNVHVVPRGLVTIKDPHGNQVGRSIINPDSSLILPEHTRIYKSSLTSSKKLLWPGMYKAGVQYRFDGTQETSTGVITYRFINLPFWLIGAAIVVAGLWLIRRGLRRLQKTYESKKGQQLKPAKRAAFMSLRRVDGRKQPLNSKKK